MTNKTTKQYQKGIEKFDKLYKSLDMYNEKGSYAISDAIFQARFQIKSYIKQHTLSILQSEYDRLEEEKREIYKRGDFLEHRNEHNTGYNTAIQDQQTHILQTINEIKGL